MKKKIRKSRAQGEGRARLQQQKYGESFADVFFSNGHQRLHGQPHAEGPPGGHAVSQEPIFEIKRRWEVVRRRRRC